MRHRLLHAIRQVVDPYQQPTVTLDDKFDQLGLNSVTLVRLIVLVEKEFDIIFRDEDLQMIDFESGRSLLEYIEKERAATNNRKNRPMK